MRKAKTKEGESGLVEIKVGIWQMQNRGKIG